MIFRQFPTWRLIEKNNIWKKLRFTQRDFEKALERHSGDVTVALQEFCNGQTPRGKLLDLLIRFAIGEGLVQEKEVEGNLSSNGAQTPKPTIEPEVLHSLGELLEDLVEPIDGIASQLVEAASSGQDLDPQVLETAGNSLKRLVEPMGGLGSQIKKAGDTK